MKINGPGAVYVQIRNLINLSKYENNPPDYIVELSQYYKDAEARDENEFIGICDEEIIEYLNDNKTVFDAVTLGNMTMYDLHAFCLDVFKMLMMYKIEKPSAYADIHAEDMLKDIYEIFNMKIGKFSKSIENISYFTRKNPVKYGKYTVYHGLLPDRVYIEGLNINNFSYNDTDIDDIVRGELNFLISTIINQGYAKDNADKNIKPPEFDYENISDTMILTFDLEKCYMTKEELQRKRKEIKDETRM